LKWNRKISSSFFGEFRGAIRPIACLGVSSAALVCPLSSLSVPGDFFKHKNIQNNISRYLSCPHGIRFSFMERLNTFFNQKINSSKSVNYRLV
jgi:hypothetical protein